MVAAILGGISIATTIFGGLNARARANSAAKAQEQLALENARRAREESKEAIRRTRRTFTLLENTTAAMSAASGLGGLTRKRYQDVLREKNQAELDWMEKSGASAAMILEREGKVRGQITRAGGAAAMWGSLGSAFGSASRMFG